VIQTLILKNDVGECARMQMFLRELADLLSLSEDIVNDVSLALEETFTNIVFYGYDDQKEHQISLRVEVLHNQLVFQIEDRGRPFNPCEMQASDLTVELDQRAEGGMGIHLVKNVTDSLEYRRVNRTNILRLIKNFRE